MTNNNNTNSATHSVKVKPVQPRYIVLNEDIHDALNIYERSVYETLRFKADYRSKCSDVQVTVDELIKISKVKRTMLFECLNSLENKHFLIRRTNWDKKTWGKANEYEVAQHLNYFKPIVEEENEEKNTDNNNINDNTNGSYIEGVRPADYIVRPADYIVRPANDINKHEYKETYYQQNEQKKSILSINELLNNNPHALPKQMIEDWIVNRKAKKSPITFTVWNKINKELSQCKNPLDAFEQYVFSGYVGFNKDWFEKPKVKGSYDHESTDWAKGIEQDIF